MRNNKVILDTNLWISFLISKSLGQIDKLIKERKVTLIFSIESIEEFVEVANRPKFKKHFSKKDIDHLLDRFDQYGELNLVRSNIQICRDKKDNFLLSLAVDSKADYLVTGDDDLLVLEKIESTKIMTFRNFIEHIN